MFETDEQVRARRCSSSKVDRLSMLVILPSRVHTLVANGYSGTFIAEIFERRPHLSWNRLLADSGSNPKMVLHPAVSKARIDACYLDTTYLNPKYCFPPQPQVIEACATLARRTVLGMSENAPPIDQAKDEIKPEVYGEAEYQQEKAKEMMQGWLVKKEDEAEVKMENGVKLEDGVKVEEAKDEPLVEVKAKPKGRTLVVMGTYSIGKERIVKGQSIDLQVQSDTLLTVSAVAKILGSTIYCDPRKKGILLCETDPELHAMLSSDPISVSYRIFCCSVFSLTATVPGPFTTTGQYPTGSNARLPSPPTSPFRPCPRLSTYRMELLPSGWYGHVARCQHGD